MTSSPQGIDCSFKNGDAELRTGTCFASFATGSVVTLTATPAANVGFAWSGACSGSGTCAVTMSQDQTVTVTFTPLRTFTLTIQLSANGYGRVITADNRAQPKIGCNQAGAAITCTTEYPATTIAQLETESDLNAAATFSGFGPPCPSTERCVLTMDGPKTVSASFKSPAIQITAGGNGAGTVTSSQGGINCVTTAGVTTGTCFATYPGTSSAAQTVTLTATPSGASQFAGWSGGGCTGTAPCTIIGPAFFPGTMVSAQFTLPTYTIGVSGAGTGSGAVTSTPMGISCTISQGVSSGLCSGPFTSGSSVTLTATPAAGSRFVSWSGGGCSGSSTACTVSVSQAATVTARFDIANPTIAVSGNGSGSITSAPNGIACSLTDGAAAGQCTAEFTLGSSVTLSATAATGWQFAGWGGGCTGQATCTLTMNQNKAVTAAFTRPPVDLTVTATGTGTGTVVSAPTGIQCSISGSGTTGTCSFAFAFGSTVTLTPTATQGSTFQGWSGACSGGAGCSVSMTQARTATVSFAGLLIDLALNSSGTGSGVVTSNAGGMNCRVTRGVTAANGCKAGVVIGTSVTLTADPQDGSVFAGWTSGGCSGKSLTCTVTVSQAGAVGAQFTAPLPAAQLVDALLGGTPPSADEQTQLDRFGNKDGTFNLGDLLALLDRTRETISAATIASILDAERARPARTPVRKVKP